MMTVPPRARRFVWAGTLALASTACQACTEAVTSGDQIGQRGVAQPTALAPYAVPTEPRIVVPPPTEASPNGPRPAEALATTAVASRRTTETSTAATTIVAPTSAARSPSTAPAATTDDVAPALAPRRCDAWSDDGAGFLPDRWELPADLDQQLVIDAQRLLVGRFSRVDVVGHTDERPTPLGNDELSLRRAEAVVARLVELGVAGDLLHTVARGERDRVATGHDEAAHAANRRIEIVGYC